MKAFFKLIMLVILGGIFFSFAMFQGGFLSWFLFYSYIPFFIYYIFLLIYPLKDWKVETSSSTIVAHAGDDVTLSLTIKRKIPFPIPFVLLQVDIPESLNKKDTRRKGKSLFSDRKILVYPREVREIFFPYFRRKIQFTFVLDQVPRGEHQFNNFTITCGDLFGFISREHTFSMKNQLVVYPVERQIKVTQYLSSFDGSAVPYYAQHVKNTTVASGIRDYVPGDKFSWIDWKQTARQQSIMTKEFDQEKSAEMLIIFNRSVSEYMKPIAFEAAVELTLAMFDDMAKKNSGVNFVSIGKEYTHFAAEDVFKRSDKIRHHFAIVHPLVRSTSIMTLGNHISTYEKYDTYIFVTTVVDRAFIKTVDSLRFIAKKIVVLYIQGSEFIVEEEQKYMQLLRANGVNVNILSDRQLSFDPIEVKF